MTAADGIGQLVERGGPWTLLAITFIVIAKLYADLREERTKRIEEKDARIADAQAYAMKIVEGQKEVATISANLGKVADAQEAERDERERAQRELAFQHMQTGPIRPIKR